MGNQESKRRCKQILSWVLVWAMVVTVVPTGRAEAKSKSITSIVAKMPTSLALEKGENYQWKLSVKPISLSGKVSYHSSKKSVVSVSGKGKLRARKVGRATITATSRTKPKKKTKLSVTVVKKLVAVKKLALSSKKLTMKVGDKETLKAKLNTKSSRKPTIKGVVYQSSKKSVASVTKKGVVTAKKVGTAKITAYAKDGRGASASCKVVVSEETSASVAPTASVLPSSAPNASPSATVTPSPRTSVTPVVSASPQVSEEPAIPVAGIQQNEDNAFIFTKGEEASTIYVDKHGDDYDGLSLVATSFAEDLKLVAEDDVNPVVINRSGAALESTIVVGSIGNNDLIDEWIEKGLLNVDAIRGKREVYQIAVLDNPSDAIQRAVVVVGSDKRGAIYGLYHISELLGVSPWTYWADVATTMSDKNVLTKSELTTVSKEPSVTYRGIFLNDEAPSLTGWVKDEFGNYNEEFYEKVYELILRLKGNYLWPAMWSNTFSADGKSSPIANAELADRYGIVMGTSHHEPLCRAGVEWQNTYSKYGSSNAWDFAANREAITRFWRGGLERNGSYENVITLGMRGESDSSLEGTIDENIALLKDVITTQKQLLSENNLSQAPQVLTVYKEVEDYWHGTSTVDGLKKWNVLNDVTIMLCDDNFGNMRTLPEADQKNRAGGWGMYYHFDYHGGPTSYEWVNSTPLEKVWEQMTMAYDYGIDDIWIVNVGDLKPMEMDISYFLDLAYDYDTWGKNGIDKTKDYQEQWVEEQFGQETTEDVKTSIEELISEYTWLNGSCKPETLSSATYSTTNYEEAKSVLARCEAMIQKAEATKASVPNAQQAAYYELVYFPTVASANVAKIQLYAGLNSYCYNNKLASANLYAMLLEEAIAKDKALENEYNNNIPGAGNKWKNMMSSPHVGFVSWNSEGWKYPTPLWYKTDSQSVMAITVPEDSQVHTEGTATLPTINDKTKKTYTLELSNQGGTAYQYEALASAEWIQLSQTAGEVSLYERLSVSVDFSKVTANTNGTVTITAGDQTIVVNVNVEFLNIQEMQAGTYLYANGYASMSAAGFTTKGDSADGGAFKVIPGYGKMGDSIKAFPSYVSYDGREEEAPYVEYRVNVPEAGEYTLTTFSAASNPVSKDTNTIRYGVAVNSGNIEVTNSIASNYVSGAYSGSWSNDVKANGRRSTTAVTLNAGVNTIRYYAVDPSFVLQKAVVSKEALLASHLGPKVSYAVGDVVTDDYEVPMLVHNDSYACPGNILITEDSQASGVTMTAGEAKNYSVVITEEEDYEFKIKGSSNDQAVVRLSFNSKEIGTVILKSVENVVTLEKSANLKLGLGTLTLSVVSGNATISAIKSKTVNHANIRTVDVSASSQQDGHEAALAMDEETETAWMPETNETNPWIEVDLDDVYLLDRFVLIESGIESVQLEAIVDGVGHTIYESDEVASGATVMLQGTDAISAEKLRFTFIGSNITLQELQIQPYINWATKDTGVVLTGAKNGGEAFDVSTSIVDGDRITKGMVYSAGGNSDSTRHQVSMKFSQPRSIDTVRLVSLQEAENVAVGTGSIPDDSMTSNLAQYSYNVFYLSGGKWISIGGTTKPASGNPKVFNEFTLKTPVLAEGIKVEIYTSNWIRINELEAIQSERLLAAVPVGRAQFTEPSSEFEVTCEKESNIKRIVAGPVDDRDLTYEYYDTATQSYLPIDEDDVDTFVKDGELQCVFAKAIHTTKIRMKQQPGASEQANYTYLNAYPEVQTTTGTATLEAPVITNNENVVIAFGKPSKKLVLRSEAVASGNVEYRYMVVEDTDNIAQMEGNQLRVSGEGDVTIRVSAISNGLTRYGMKTFHVTQATEASPTYKNYAQSVNGGSIVVSDGGNGEAANLNDGDTSYQVDTDWQSGSVPAYAEVYFDGMKEIDEVCVYSKADAAKNLNFYYMKNGKWIEIPDSKISGNTTEKAEFALDEAIQTPALRVEITQGATDGKTYLSEIEAYGDIVATSGCICQLGAPTFTNGSQVDIDKTTGKGQITLGAEAVHYAAGCQETEHSTNVVQYAYSLVSNPGSVATLTQGVLEFKDMGTVEVKVTATLGTLVTSNTMFITANKAGYTNYALASNGSQASGSEISEDMDPNNVLDGDVSFANGKRWRTTSFPSYMEVDFGQERTIDLISLFSQQESGTVAPTTAMTSKFAPAKFKVSYWDTATMAWKVFEGGTVTGNNKVWHKLSLATPVTTTKIRYDCETAVCDNWWRIIEIQAWGFNK